MSHTPSRCEQEDALQSNGETSVCESANWLTRNTGPVVLMTHTKPDGDAFGSVVALQATLEACGIQCQAWFVPPVPRALDAMPGADKVQRWQADTVVPEAASYVVLDTAAWSQLGPQRKAIEPYLERMLIVDHHLSGDVQAKRRWVDTASASCCEMVAKLIERIDPQRQFVKGEAAKIVDQALFIGLASDTGWFRFSNTTPSTHLLAAKLIARGVDHAKLYRELEQQDRPERLRLMGRALTSMKLFADDRGAMLVLRQNDFAETGASYDETERLIDLPQLIETIQVVALVTQRVEGDEEQIRVSFRSKHEPNAVNVAELAKQFGGGGHARAAGATLEMSMDEAVEQIENALKQALS